MRLKWVPSILVLALFASSALAAPQVRYRILPITGPLEGGLTATAMNNRGEVVGTRGASNGQYAFMWRDGRFVDLASRIHPTASYTEASGVNDRSQVVGFYVDPDAGVFRGFLLDRWQVTEVQGPPTAEAVFLGAINDREQIFGTYYDDAGNEGYFLNEEGNVLVIGPPFYPTDINVAGTLSGTVYEAGTSVASVWEEGVVTPIAPSPSTGSDLNDRGQVIGSLQENNASRAFVWNRGQLIVLPALLENQTASWANDINNAGRIVGQTVVNQPSGTLQLATLWHDGEVTDLNTLIHPDDPLRAYVSLTSATLINDRGEIVALGRDSRVAYLQYYFLKRVRWP